MTPTPPVIQRFQVPKAGRAQEACEDAYRFRFRNGITRLDQPPVPLALRVALADGATASSGSRLWARLLTRAAVEAVAPLGRSDYFLPKLADLRRRWRRLTEAALPARRAWFADAALDRGAFATLLRLRIRDGRWQAEAMGDSCLLHYRGDALLRSFPLETPEAFQANPDLLASAPGFDEDLPGRIRTAEGRLHHGDLLVLATDAVACWILGSGRWPDLAARLAGPVPEAAFAAWTEEERLAGHLKNDDSTLLLIRIP